MKNVAYSIKRKLANWLCREEMERWERFVEEIRSEKNYMEELHVRTAQLHHSTITEPDSLFLAMECPCGNKMHGVFKRSDGFEIHCSKCNSMYRGGISGFDDKSKEAFEHILRKSRHGVAP